MQYGLIRILSAIAGKSKKILDAGCILFCFIMLFSMTGCGTGKDKIKAAIKTGGNSYSVKNLDFCKIADNEICTVESIDYGHNTVAVRVWIYNLFSSSNNREIIVLYDSEGTLKSQINTRDAIGSDKACVDLAINTSGNLVVFARSQGDDNVVHNYLYSFDSAGKLAGEALDLNFDESFFPLNFVIGTDDSLYFGSYSKFGMMTLGREIYVLDSEGNPFFDVSYERLVGNLYQTGDMIYTDSNKGGTDSGNSAQLLPIDTANRKIGDSIDISKVTSSGGAVCSGSDGFYLINFDGIYSINLGTQKTKEILLWKDTDTDLTAFENDFPAFMISSDKIFLLSSLPSKTRGTALITVSLLTREG